LKKFYKIWAREQNKAGDKAKKEAEDAEKRAKNLEEAKKIVIHEDSSKPTAKEAKICHLSKLRGERIKVYGWVHRLRRQGLHFYYTRVYNLNTRIIFNRQIIDVYYLARWHWSSSMCSV
jgi:asparaginyl-tRNA synthetase